MTADKKLMFPPSVQRSLNAFAFFLAYPFFYILGNSFSFFIFIIVLLNILKNRNNYYYNENRHTFLFIWFLFAAGLSLLFVPKMDRYPGVLADLQLLFQYGYWILIALFISRYARNINIYLFSKWLTIGMLCSILFFFLFPEKLDFDYFALYFVQTRNFLVFNLLSITPISFFYISKRYGKTGIIVFSFFSFIFMLLTTGRAGSILILIEIFIVFLIYFPGFRRISRVFLLVLIVVFSFVQNINLSPISNSFAELVQPINPRFAKMIRGQAEGEGDVGLEEDKSWLIRRLMVDKSLEIFSSYPITGIGINHFGYYDSKLSTLNEYVRLESGSEDFYNSRSAHNSYFQLLAEMGLLGAIPFTLIILIPNFFFVKKLFTNKIDYRYLPLLSLFGVSIYFYAISSITGTISWFVIGLAFFSYNSLKTT